ncbi:uncharacterized protein LOC111634023 [Centruroides sculpturatus]|uniref:uncharacterized protein LOC111634023 n=1 Tax=Centruroides sculpturatus TaxID=218467 RepID=UPI000C6CA63B|nr:uncharacterized protein LOC111634023 [Centruroides sculpturatus]
MIAVNVLIFIGFMSSAYSLECYVCEDQDTNYDKCIKTIRTCDVGQDRCLTEIKWGSTPYWAPSGEKQFYISKSCANNKSCADIIKSKSSLCDRIWYNDWECAECCHGNRCNYYVTLSGSHLQSNILISSCMIIFTWIIKFL